MRKEFALTALVCTAVSSSAWANSLVQLDSAAFRYVAGTSAAGIADGIRVGGESRSLAQRYAKVAPGLADLIALLSEKGFSGGELTKQVNSYLQQSIEDVAFTRVSNPSGADPCFVVDFTDRGHSERVWLGTNIEAWMQNPSLVHVGAFGDEPMWLDANSMMLLETAEPNTSGHVCTIQIDCTGSDRCTGQSWCTKYAFCTWNDWCTKESECTNGLVCTGGDDCTVGTFCTGGDNCTDGVNCTDGPQCTDGINCTWSDLCPYQPGTTSTFDSDSSSLVTGRLLSLGSPLAGTAALALLALAAAPVTVRRKQGN